MNSIHSTAIVSSNAKIGKNVVIGPNCIINNGVVIGDECKLIANVYNGQTF